MRDRDRLVCLVLFALLLRLLCGLHPYSGALHHQLTVGTGPTLVSDSLSAFIAGQRTPPRFGDYEAQRHWMEIAVGMPARLW